jgi:hypothetical protein
MQGWQSIPHPGVWNSGFLDDVLDELGQLIGAGWQMFLAGVLQLLEVRELADWHFDPIPEQIPEPSAEGRNHLVPEPAFFADFPRGLRPIQQVMIEATARSVREMGDR